MSLSLTTLFIVSSIACTIGQFNSLTRRIREEIDDPHIRYQTEPRQWPIEHDPPNDEQRLLRHLMHSYDKSVRPVYNASHVVTVEVGLTLTHIFNVDEKKQVLTMNAWLAQQWLDERLGWNESDFANISQLTVPAMFLWMPDIVLYNNAQDFAHGIAQTNVALYSSGWIYRLPPVKFHSTCKMDVAYFPFDDQICYLHFGSWIYDGKQMDVVNASHEVTIDAGSFTENGEWAIIDTTVRRYLRRPFSGYDREYPALTFALHLRRRALFFLYNIIFPCVMLSILTLMQFWLPCESGEKVTLGLTVLLAYSVFSFNIAENMPETSDVVPLIGIYLMAIMGISAVSVILSVVVLNVRDGGERKVHVPTWLQFLAYRILAPFVCWSRDARSFDSRYSDGKEINFHAAFQSLGEQLLHQESHNAQHHIDEGLAATGNFATMMVTAKNAHGTNSVGMKPVQYEGCKSMQAALSFADEVARRTNQSTSSVDEQREILCRAGRLMDRIENEQESDYLLHEWRKVSRIFDNFFFLVILFATFGTTFFLLVFAPRFRHRNLIEESLHKVRNDFGRLD